MSYWTVSFSEPPNRNSENSEPYYIDYTKSLKRLLLRRCARVVRGFRWRDLLQCQNRPTTVSKETYYSVKIDLLQCQKRPTTVSKETYYSVKRDLLQCQQRPTTVSKEINYSVKRDLLQCQKRPGPTSHKPLPEHETPLRPH